MILKDISASADLVTCLKRQRTQPKGRPSEGGVGGRDQWPRIYGKPVHETVKAKRWELRNYNPNTINDLTKY